DLLPPRTPAARDDRDALGSTACPRRRARTAAGRAAETPYPTNHGASARAAGERPAAGCRAHPQGPPERPQPRADRAEARPGRGADGARWDKVVAVDCPIRPVEARLKWSTGPSGLADSFKRVDPRRLLERVARGDLANVSFSDLR